MDDIHKKLDDPDFTSVSDPSKGRCVNQRTEPEFAACPNFNREFSRKFQCDLR